MTHIMSPTKDLLVVGGDGVIGKALLATARTRGIEADGTTRRPIPGAMHIDLASGPLEAPETIYGCAVICAAVTRIVDCESDPVGSRRVNVEAPTALARKLAARGTQVILLSTSHVFDGSAPLRRADDPTNPISLYGRQKVEAETGILACPGGTVLRLTKVLAPGQPLIAGWSKDLSAGRPISPFRDVGFAPIPIDLAVETTLAVAASRGTGIWHMSAERDITYAEAALTIAEVLGVPASLVTPIETPISLVGQVQTHTALCTARATAATGLRAPNPIDVVRRMLPGQGGP